MRVTFEDVRSLGRNKGLHVERTGRQIEVWADCDHSVTAVCESVEEAYVTVYHHIPGGPVS